MDGYTVKRIDDLSSIMNGAVKLAGDELAVRSFGMQVLDLPAGFTDYPEHDHAQDGQEEVYIVLAGSAELTVAGERVEAAAGSMVRVDPAAKRKLIPGADGARILAIGGARDYERPNVFRVTAHA